MNFLQVGPHWINVAAVSRFYVDETTLKKSVIDSTGVEFEKVLRISIYFTQQTADQAIVLTGQLAVSFLNAFGPRLEEGD